MLHTPQSVCSKDDAAINIPPISVTLDTSHLEMSPLNDDAEANMPSMLVTLATSHLEMSPLNNDAEANMPAMVVTLDTSHLEMSPWNDDAEANMSSIFVALDTSHFDMSPLKDFALANTALMSVTIDTSHLVIGPWWEQSPLGDHLRHVSIAFLSSVLDENAAEVVHTGRDMDSSEPVNMSFLLAFDLAHASPHNTCLKDVAPLNILFMMVTLDTSHFEMSPLKDVAYCHLTRPTSRCRR